MLFAFHYHCTAQMPPPGYERAKKIQEEQMKVSILDRDSLTLIDTVEIFDPTTYESETKIVNTRFSLRDYCLKYLGIGNADILLDRNPHTVIDPKTYGDITIRLNASGKLDTIPK
ncbi:MAG: hypothetical protein IPP15_19780 [Saprospiraceae bacterium]|uniref:Uncharacterized protein n=1 Tax=Candidatus Opimibacter skivensis TaxID=2982028 RepID=A0A9D7T1G1_9BACT|nr:hypothetical protein [Candidatus Opimibacter skivensis]